jgi:hypothetical protein
VRDLLISKYGLTFPTAPVSLASRWEPWPALDQKPDFSVISPDRPHRSSAAVKSTIFSKL